MKKAVLSFTVLLGFIFNGCGSIDTEINAFVTDSDKTTSEIVRQIKANPTAAGVDEAQKILDGSKADLRKQYDALKNAHGYQVQEETMRKFTDSVFKNAEAINKLRFEYLEQTIDDAAFGEKLDKLINDFNEIYEV